MGTHRKIKQHNVDQAKDDYTRASDKNIIQLIWTAIGDALVNESIPFWCTYTGQTEDAVQNWGWMDALHPDDREQAMALWSQAIENKLIYETNYRIRQRDDTYHFFHLRYVPIMHGNGQLKEWISWITDVATEPARHIYIDQPNPSLYGLIFEQAAVGMTCTSLEGRYLQVNDLFCKTIKYSREEILGKSFQVFTYPEDREIGAEILHRMLSKNIPLQPFEKRYICKDGQIIWLKITTTLLKNTLQEPLFFLSLAEDITVQKHADAEHRRLQILRQEARAAEERAHQESLELSNLLQTVFRSMSESVVVFDLEGRLLHANEAARQLLDLGSENHESLIEIIARYDIRDEHNQKPGPDTLPFHRILQGETLANSQSVDIIIYESDAPTYWINISGAPLYNQQGQTIGGVCVFRDVTAQRQKTLHAEKALNALLTMVDALVSIPDTLEDGFAGDVAIPNFSITTVGQRLAGLIQQVLECPHASLVTIDPETAKLALVGIAGFTNEEVQQYFHEMSSAYLSDYLDAREIEQLCNNELLVRNLLERPFAHGLSFGRQQILLAPWFSNNQLIGVFSIDKLTVNDEYLPEDIALVRAVAQLTTIMIERVRLLNEWAESHANELALQEANRRFNAFISLASHELKTPLTTIKGNIQLALRRLNKLKHQEQEPASALGILERVAEPLDYAIQRVGVEDRLISDLLDSSRIQSNKLEFVMRPVDLAEIIQRVVLDLQQTAADRPITVHMDTDRPILITADADRIEQVVNNYVINALKYSPASRPIEVILQIVGENARVEVRDEGPGLTPEEQQHVWDRFYRVPGVQVQQYGAGPGLGLGLYICRTIIERHHGQIGLKSATGSGSTFWFTLPLDTTAENASNSIDQERTDQKEY